MKLRNSFLLMLLFIGSTLFAQESENFKTYKLENGLTVVLDRDATQDMVFGVVATNAGSRDEELNATGMAHYLEHMLFKGTEQLGTSNWQKEKPLIEKTFALYDQLQTANTKEEIEKIYKEINAATQEASKYAIPNEITKLVQQMGGVGMNASTGFDLTQYYNAFPPNQLEPWLDLYAHRFQKPVFRLFQTELETVYEEKNRAADNPNNAYFNEMMKATYGEHPYGRPIIGYTEHLKKPWLSEMKEFFDTWYVPNNMVLVLSGNFDMDTAQKLIADKFGKWQRKELPQKTYPEIKKFKGKEKVKVKLTQVLRGELIFRGAANSEKDELALDVASELLSNSSQTGLLDKLNLDGSVMFAGAGHRVNKDGSTFQISFAPVFDVNQRRQLSFKSAESLIKDEVDNLKKGKYEDWLLDQVKHNMLKEYKLMLESASGRALRFVDMFVKGKDLKTFFEYQKEIALIDKAVISNVVKKYIGKNYLAFYSYKGDPDKDKVEKPDFDPIEPVKHEPSEYAKHFSNIPTTKAERKFVDLQKDVKSILFQDKVKLHYVPNKKNDVFSMDIVFHVGTQKFPMLEYSVALMNNAGVLAQYKPDELRKEFGKLGVSYSFSTNDYYTTVSLQGLEDNLAQACQLISRLTLMPKIEEKGLNRIIGMEYQERILSNEMQNAQLQALKEYIRHKDKSKYIDRISLKDLMGISPSELTGKLNKALAYSADIHYYGKMPLKNVYETLKNNLALASQRVDGGNLEQKQTEQYDKNTIFLVNNPKASQSNIYIFVNGTPIPLEKAPFTSAFNQYFSGGFNGLMMKEIREFRSLAYSAGAYMSSPLLPTWNSDFYGSIGTQSDKTVEAIDVTVNLLKNMPEYPERMQGVKDYLINSSYLARPSDRSLSYNIYRWKLKGYNEDPTKQNLPIYEKMNFSDLVAFYKEYISGKPYVIGIVGNAKKINKNELEKYGEVIRVNSNKLFSKE